MEGSITNTCALNELIALPASSYGHHFVSCPLIKSHGEKKEERKGGRQGRRSEGRNKRKVCQDYKTAGE